MTAKNDRYAEIKRKIIGYAGQDAAIEAVVAIGSSTRSDIPADEYSDLDLIIATSEPEKWYSGEYPALFGNIRISFIEPTLGGGKERRSIYDEDKDVDMIIFTPVQFETAINDGTAGWVMNRGYSILYDSGRFSEMIEKNIKPVVTRPEMTEEEFVNIVNDFFFHNIWAYKKLRRGELWSAKMCIDAYLKERLLKMIEQYEIVSGSTDVWHDGRFIDRWADRSIVGELVSCFAHYDTGDCRKALTATHRLFARLASFVAEKRGYSYPVTAQECAAAYLNKI
ncbi:MAG: aminoglycoside 6-adenylyltransferase [Ruminiclostridium sp.]|nr:aminoglycoside 6-adenylyltransferase [Ruminiclostridium sp.]